MSKKNFTGGRSSLQGDQPDKPEKTYAELCELDWEIAEYEKRGRPKAVSKTITKSSQEGTKENETRATFIVNEELLEKLKAIAYWDRILIKEVLNTALQEAVTKYEKKNGAVKPIPTNK
jgi:hypothetical protein